MKLYSYQPAPNPRRTRIFIAEKGLEIPVEEVDLRAGEQHADAFTSRNPARTVPVLELDDGECISDSVAICQYLEALHPEPALLGRDPLERARVMAWIRRIESEGMLALAESLRNSVEVFRDRAVPGPYRVPQVEALGARGRDRAEQFFGHLDAHLQGREYLVNDRFSFADITALVTVDFSGWIQLDAKAGHPALAAWHQRVSGRPSARA